MTSDKAIEENCGLAMSPVTKSHAMYIDQAHWAVSLAKTDQMEIFCNTNRHVKTTNPPFTIIKLQPAVVVSPQV